MDLPAPGKPLPLSINLALVHKLEEEAGSLCGLAERAARHAVSFRESLKLLRVAYAHAGSALGEAEIGAHLLQHGPAPPLLLCDLLLEILEPQETPAREFLEAMLEKFPDGEKTK